MRIPIRSILTITFSLCMVLAPPPVQSAGRLRIAHRSFKVADESLTNTIKKEISSLDTSVFHGSISNDEDRTALNQFFTTVASQADIEKWRDVSFDIWVGGEKSPAGYYVRYTGIDSKGVKIEGGGTIVTDRKTAMSLAADIRPYPPVAAPW